ncbi:MAG: aldehyde dehydrogenase family protein [Betaproteobacteria bacterium]|jgi:sulfoacetaldehyde dehydrogenase|nr:aldehyde dehydrogenase family protein [Betaproteobacteria bacterium]
MSQTDTTAAKTDAQAEIAAFMERARAAQEAINHYTQEQVDALVLAVGWNVVKHKETLARAAVDEGGFGNYESKVMKIRNRVTGTIRDMQGQKTVGVCEELPERGIVKIAKPVGVIAALIPTTGPDATPPVNALAALKGRNAIIVAPHPRTAGTSALAVQLMREGCKKVGAPEDLIQIVTRPSIGKTAELMRQADLVVATGGEAMVKAAYSSGTPAYGVGVGNGVHVVDETGDLDDAAAMIARAKVFDFATSCLADNALVAHASIYASLLTKLMARGGYVLNSDEKAKLQRLMWPTPGQAIPVLDVIAKSASHIAKLAGFAIPQGATFLIVEDDGTGPAHPFSGEKLSVVLAAYRYDGSIAQAVDLVNAITGYQGLGHTCGIHTTNDAHVEALAMGTRTARVMVNQDLNEGAGSPRNGMPYTLSLSCGTWGGNITTENVNVRHFLNYTWVSRLVNPGATPVTDESLFAGHWAAHGR